MKKLFLAIALIICLGSKGQVKKFPPDSINDNWNKLVPSLANPFVDTAVVMKRHHNGNLALVYLDSELVVDIPLFDVNALESLKVENGYNEKYKTTGNVYLTTKKSVKLNLLTIDDIKKKYSITNSNNQMIWMVDNDFVERIQYFKIDSFYLYKIEVQELPVLDSANKNTSGLTVIRIFTRTPENVNKFSGIRIRGLNAKL